MRNPVFLDHELPPLPECRQAVCQIKQSTNGLTLVNANQSFLTTFARPTYQQIDLGIGKPLHEICRQVALVAAINQHVNIAVQPSTCKITEDGRVLYFSIDSAIEIQQPNHLQWMVFIQDITALCAKVAEADAASRMKSMFLATMSHEIRTPMQPLYGLLELLQAESTEPRQQDTIAAAKNAASSLLQILDDVLDLAKVEAGKMDLEQFEVPLRTLVDGVMITMNQRAKEHNILLHAEFDPGLPRIVMGDPKRLRQILMNLISNAIKYTEQGHVVLRLSAKENNQDDLHFRLRFEVEDTGVGISNEAQKTLFEPFSRGDLSSTRKYPGTGLGLSVCKHLVELMRGDIGVHSVVGQGSTFWFEIPTVVVTDAQQPVNSLPNLRDTRILVVEDHPQGAKSMMQSLQSMGAHVQTVELAEHAEVCLANRRYDVVIVDYQLPDMAGTELLGSIAKSQPNAGLILHTVFDSQEIRDVVKSCGAVYLSKPASRMGLGQAVESLLTKVHVAEGTLSKRILIVEDTASVRDVLHRQLRHLNIDSYVMVENGIEALAALETEAFSMIITDVHMPKMDGFMLMDKILEQEQWRTVPVIALTADVQLINARAYLQHGFKECLLKPVALDQLRRMLLRWGVTESKAI